MEHGYDSAHIATTGFNARRSLMRTIRRILVAVKDLQAGSHPSVRKAAQIAAACKAQVELYHCLSEPLPVDMGFDGSNSFKSLESDLRANALQRLERLAATIRGKGLKVSVDAGWDSPAYDAIVRRALKIKADLIVASSHHGTHLLQAVMRLTDWELVRLSPVPLLLVKNARAYRNPAVLVAVDPTHAFAKPLNLDAALLQSGAALSRSLKGTLHAVHAYVRLPSGFVPPEAMAVTDHALRQIEQQTKQAAEKAFNAELKGSSIPPARRYLIGRHPVDAILQAARKSRSAILVMGAVSRSGLKRLLIGNTAESILDQLSCDVLVVKPDGFRNKVPRGVQGPRLIMPMPAPWPGGY
jgi:universal stress protein E